MNGAEYPNVDQVIPPKRGPATPTIPVKKSSVPITVALPAASDECSTMMVLRAGKSMEPTSPKNIIAQAAAEKLRVSP